MFGGAEDEAGDSSMNRSVDLNADAIKTLINEARR